MKLLILTMLILLLTTPAFAQKKITDAKLEGLKGNVKSVVTETVDLQEQNGKSVEVPRVLESQYDFDENGNRTQVLSYLFNDKSTYALVDGEKTYKSSHIKEDKKPLLATTISGGTSDNNSKARDPRYSIKLKYDYDSAKRILEVKIYLNDGKFVGRNVYKFDEKGFLKQEDGYGEILQDRKIIYKYDAAGVEIEHEYTSVQVRGAGGTMYFVFTDYKFDAEGNWIQRTQNFSYEKGINSKVKRTVYYRKISYY